jgi:hypothetical protein
MLESILTLLVEEVRELKKSNLDLHKEVVLLREKQEQTDEKVDRITQTARASLSRSLVRRACSTCELLTDLTSLSLCLACVRVRWCVAGLQRNRWCSTFPARFTPCLAHRRSSCE